LKNEIIIGDCIDILPKFPDKTFDLAILDPPYYKIKADSWDRQWKTFSEYLDWLEGVCLEVKRVLKDNGSLYVFGDDRNIAYVQVRLDKHFTFLNSLIWYKKNVVWAVKYAGNMRRYAPCSERLLFYANGSDVLDVNNFKNLRNYFKEFQEALGLKLKQINTILGHRKAEHAFYWGSTQWDLPTPETYKELLSLPRSETFEVREYEDLRREYEDLRRPFNPLPNIFEVFDIVVSARDKTEHPTTKPKELIKTLIQCSTNEGALILDPFAGSGTSLIAAKETGRYCIAIEKEEKYLPIIQERGQLNNPSLEAFVK
jgi:adenine-specific DNA-methyltransferase